MTDTDLAQALRDDIRRCLDDVATEFRARGRDDTRFVRLIARMDSFAAHESRAQPASVADCEHVWIEYVQPIYKSASAGDVIRSGESGVRRYENLGFMCDKCGAVKPAQPASVPDESVATTAESKLAEAGVFKGQHGLRGLLGANAFWERQPYGTRLYYGDGIADYLHRDVLDAAVKLLDTHPPEPARDAKDAARFHWLLENCSTNGGLGVEIFIGDEAPDAENLIERIDAAMAQEPGE